MAEAIYDVVMTITRRVRVKFDITNRELLREDEDPEDVAEEFARGGKRLWPDYVISTEEEADLDSIMEVKSTATLVTSS